MRSRRFPHVIAPRGRRVWPRWQRKVRPGISRRHKSSKTVSGSPASSLPRNGASQHSFSPQSGGFQPVKGRKSRANARPHFFKNGQLEMSSVGVGARDMGKVLRVAVARGKRKWQHCGRRLMYGLNGANCSHFRRSRQRQPSTEPQKVSQGSASAFNATFLSFWLECYPTHRP